MRNLLKVIFLFAMALLAPMTPAAETEKTVYPVTPLRSEDYQPNPLTCFGLGFVRVVTSPCELGVAVAQYFQDPDNEHSLTAQVCGAPIAVPIMLVCGSLMMCCDVVIGCAEMVTFSQMKELHYPWEMPRHLTKAEREESVAAAKARLKKQAGKLVSTAANVAVDATLQAVEQAADDAIEQGVDHAFGVRAGEGLQTDNQDVDASSGGGFGKIKGRTALGIGQTAVYYLYVGGKKITGGVEWRASGTSITVNNCGDHARAMAGNPPIKRGTYKTGIAATYMGKTYRMTIKIVK